MFAPRGKLYDSSDDDSDESFGHPYPRSTPAPAADDKKKKKPKPPPQESINKIWERFSKKQFSNALHLLPFEPVPPSTSNNRANELLAAGYERAAEECRRKVRKIIQECKRVNMRYRDPGFDLDWDLKWEKGHTLNYLGKTKFRISATTLLDPNSSIPKAVKRVHEIFENPTFMKNINGSDIKQGGLGNCWFIASLSGLANVEDAVRRCCVEYNTRIGIYGFVFYRDGEWIYSIIDDKLFLKSPNWDDRSMQRDLLQQIDRDEAESVYRKTYQTGSKALFFAQNKDQNETWLPLIEKAYAKAHGDYASLIGGWVGEGIEDLTGGVTTELLSSDILDTDAFWDDELSKVNKEFMFGCSTGLLDGGTGDRHGIAERHAYNVVEARTLKDGTRLVKLRNPWGAKRRGLWEGAYSDGSKEWNKEVTEELGHSFGSDSVFWITYEDMLRKFLHLDRSRLFREPDWRCCQRWIGVDVPWMAQYHEKFHIKLTVDSPLVLALSQLDKRYFKGLSGQYLFDLHFRVHEQDRPDAEDYIVRSNGNYLMLRGVAVEIPEMTAGNYSIWMSITAERMTGVPSVEDVVKRECKSREENDKLAQAGRAYDLAHSKAASHLAEVARQRKASQKTKESDERKKERHKAWQKRHIQRNIQKAQEIKNKEKKERRKTERRAVAERRKAEEEVAAAAAAKKAAEEKQAAEAAAEAAAKKEAEEKNQAHKDKKDDSEGKSAGEVADKPKDESDENDKAPKDKKDDTEGKSADESADKAKDEAKEAASVDATSQEEDEKDKKVTTDEASQRKDQAVQTDGDSTATTEGGAAEKTKESQKPADGDDVATPLAEKDQERAESGSTTSSNSSNPMDTPLATPRSETGSATPAVPVESAAKGDKVPVPPVDGGPPPSPTVAQLPVICQYHKEQQDRTQEKLLRMQLQHQGVPLPRSPTQPKPPPPPARDEFSEDDSSDSPVSDWEELFDMDDDEPKMAAVTMINGVPVPDDDESDDETRPEPWNAICVVGLRVYSKDENLELRVVMEGGNLEEGGMGEKGGLDLDNAQVNAGGEREKKKAVEEKKDGDQEKQEKKNEQNDEKKEEIKEEGDDKKKDEKQDDEKKSGDKKDEKKSDEKKDDEKPQPPVNSGLAPYPTIVSKGDGEFEKASQPVAATEEKKEKEAENEKKDSVDGKKEEAAEEKKTDGEKSGEKDETKESAK